MNTIEAQRAKFTMVQTKLISIHNELSNLVQKAPARWFIGSREIPDLILVTSTRTENSFSTGKDDDVELFDKDTNK
jgi:hypothetical protein